MSIQKIFKTFSDSQGMIKPHFFLTGSTGSGKTFTTNYYCTKYKIPNLIINAAQLTQEGFSGSSVSRLFRPLVGVTKPTVVFLDEFDKIIISSDETGKNSIQTSVQDELLKVIEEGKAHILMDYGKYVEMNNSKLLFVLGGAFNNRKVKNVDDLQSMGVISQLIGRVPLHYHLDPLSLEYLLKILHKSPLLDSYLEFLAIDKDRVMKDLITSLESAYSMNNIGARLINKVLHKYFIDGEIFSQETEVEIEDYEI